MPDIIELHVRRLSDNSLTAELRAVQRNSLTPLARPEPVTVSAEALRGLSNLPEAYGAALSAMVFSTPLKAAWERARGAGEAAGTGIHLRVVVDDHTGELDRIRWELLRDPMTAQALAWQEAGSLARLVESETLHDSSPLAKPALRALVAIAGPSDTVEWGLDPIAVGEEAERALAVLEGVHVDLLADDHPRSAGLATLANIRSTLRDGVHVLYVICHGQATSAGTTLYLVGEDGKGAPLTGEELAAEVRALDDTHHPLLAVLLACEGASQNQAPLAAVGPLLGRAGIPAVIAMQAPITMEAAAQFTERLLHELVRDGRIDRAVAAARKEMREAWWIPVLWLRSRDGRLWRPELPADPRLADREATLRVLLHDHVGFITTRLESFVGREVELADIRGMVASLRQTGGYVTITGPAGHGKSSILARLVADAIREQSGTDDLPPDASLLPIPYHFIPFRPGPDHQVGILRNLIARLCLRHNLPALYAFSDTRPALRDYFITALQDIARRGQEDVIYIDGLDQIEEDLDGRRDLSFLPVDPPPGIVFVLGSRPNDTLAPLELCKPHVRYPLPPLSREDFDRILLRRSVALPRALADRFYAAMEANALYLDLAARELAMVKEATLEPLVARLTANPNHLFSLSVERLRRDRQCWRETIKPILGYLLVTRAPLSVRVLCDLLNQDDELVRDGIDRLGGLLQRDGEGRVSLYHLKFRDFLRQDETRPEEAYVFSADDEETYHQRIGDWCLLGIHGANASQGHRVSAKLAEERSHYAHQHTVAHLAAARAYAQLWTLLDTTDYLGTRWERDPSAEGILNDLDIARQASLDEAQVLTDDSLVLPRLWRYSLLRCRIASRADRVFEPAFGALAAVGELSRAVQLTEVLSEPQRRWAALREIGDVLRERGDHETACQLLVRALDTTRYIAHAHLRAMAALRLVPSLHAVGEEALAAQIVLDEDTRIRLVQFPQARILARYWQAKAAFATGQHDILEQILAEIEQLTASLPPRGYAYGQRLIGEVYHVLGAYQRAADALQRSEAAVEHILPLEHQIIALRGLCTTYQEQGDNERARSFLTRALSIIEAQGSMAQHSERERLASALVLLEPLDRMGEAARIVREQYGSESIFNDVVAALAKAGRYEEALVLARTITAPGQRVSALGHIILNLVEGDQIVRAQALAREMVAAVSSEADDDVSTRARCLFAERIARLGLQGEAQAHLEAMARELSQTLEPEDAVNHLRHIIISLLSLSAHDKIRPLLQHQEVLADKLPRLRGRDRTLFTIALCYLDLDDEASFIRVRERVQNENLTMQLDITWALEHGSTMSRVQAIARLETLVDSEQRDFAWAKLATDAAEDGDSITALNLRDRISRPWVRVYANVVLTRVLTLKSWYETSFGLPEDIRAIYELSDDPETRAIALSGLVESLAQLERVSEARVLVDQALEATRHVYHEDIRYLCWMGIVSGLVMIDATDKALEYASQTDYYKDRNRAYAAIGLVLVRQKQLEAATNIALTIPRGDERTGLLISIIEAMDKNSDEDAINDILCRSLLSITTIQQLFEWLPLIQMIPDVTPVVYQAYDDASRWVTDTLSRKQSGHLR